MPMIAPKMKNDGKKMFGRKITDTLRTIIVLSPNLSVYAVYPVRPVSLYVARFIDMQYHRRTYVRRSPGLS
jgi:hypothetical protein